MPALRTDIAIRPHTDGKRWTVLLGGEPLLSNKATRVRLFESVETASWAAYAELNIRLKRDVKAAASVGVAIHESQARLRVLDEHT